MSLNIPKTGLARTVRAWMKAQRRPFTAERLYKELEISPGKPREQASKTIYDFEKRGEISRVRPRRNQRQTSYRYSHNWKPGSKEAVKKDKIYRAMYVSTTFTVSDIQRLTDAPDRSHLDKTVKRLTDKGFLQVVGFRLCNHSIGKERLYHIVDRMRFKLEVQR